MSPHRYLNGYVPKSVGKGRVLMHHGSNWPTGHGRKEFRAWTDDKPPEGFVPCPCEWAGLPHYAREDHVQAYQRRVKKLEKKHADVWGEEDLSSGVHKWG
jgi:hypothetical protein